jgi:hypothetical protein
VLADEKLEDSDIESAPKLIEAVLQNCRGRVDQWLEPYLRISVERLRRTQKNYLKDLLMEVVQLFDKLDGFVFRWLLRISYFFKSTKTAS